MSTIADSAAPDEPSVDETTSALATTAGTSPVAQGGVLDRVVRRALLLQDAEPRALLDLQGSLVLSCIRCILTYVVIPVGLPLLGWAEVVATPLALVLSLAAVALAVRSLRRVWQANWTHRWAYTAFIVVVIGLIGIEVGFDVATLLA